MSIGLSGGLGGDGARTGSLHTDDLYLDCLVGGLPSKDGMTIDRGYGLQDTIGRSEGLDCGCGIGCNFALVVLHLAPALLCPFLGTGGIIL